MTLSLQSWKEKIFLETRVILYDCVGPFQGNELNFFFLEDSRMDKFSVFLP